MLSDLEIVEGITAYKTQLELKLFECTVKTISSPGMEQYLIPCNIATQIPMDKSFFFYFPLSYSHRP